MRINTSTEYAARLMVSLAKAGAEPMSADRLSHTENVPPDYVNQLLLRLRRAGLVVSHRGTGGGYSLSRPASQIRLGELLRAVEGKIFESVCEKYSEGPRDCNHQERCGLSPVWQKLGSLIESYLDGITLSSLLDEQRPGCGRVAAIFDSFPTGKP